MLRLGVKAGTLLGVFSACCYLAWLALSTEAPDTHPTILTGIFAVLGFFVGSISTIIGADLVAWRTGGYAGEFEESSHFRELG